MFRPGTRSLLSTLLAVFCVAGVGPSSLYASQAPRGTVDADEALVYFLQSGGTTQHVFSEQQWLGVVRHE